MAFHISNFDPNRHVGYESRKAYRSRFENYFWDEYIVGPSVLDIACKGGDDGLPIFDFARSIELSDPDYDGLHLPVPDGSQDTIHASHLLEHVAPPEEYIAEWFSKLRVGGTLLIFVPHTYLYERRLSVPPSQWSGEHLRSYTPSSLLAEIERALRPNTYRVRRLADNDVGYMYALPPEAHPIGCLEIELVLEKIQPPSWQVE